MNRRLILFPIFLLFIIVSFAQDDAGYKLPPKDIADMLLAKPTPNVTVNENGDWMIFSEISLYPSVEELARPELKIAWWAPHAPEPLTFVHWFENARQAGTLPPEGSDVRVLHPDPPLGPDERLVLEQVLSLARPGAKLDIMTPRLLAARGG